MSTRLASSFRASRRPPGSAAARPRLRSFYSSTVSARSMHRTRRSSLSLLTISRLRSNRELHVLLRCGSIAPSSPLSSGSSYRFRPRQSLSLCVPLPGARCWLSCLELYSPRPRVVSLVTYGHQGAGGRAGRGRSAARRARLAAGFIIERRGARPQVLALRPWARPTRPPQLRDSTRCWPRWPQ